MSNISGAGANSNNIFGSATSSSKSVTLDTDQTITGRKRFKNALNEYSGTLVNPSISAAGVTITGQELSYLDGASSNLQTQLDSKASLTEDQTFTGQNEFSVAPHCAAPPLTYNDLANKGYVDSQAPLTAYQVFCNYSQSFDLNYKTLSSVENYTATTVPFSITAIGDQLIASFINTKTALFFPNTIPPGNWGLTAYANVDTTADQSHVGLKFEIIGLTVVAGSPNVYTETVIATSSLSNLIAVTSPGVGTFSCIITIASTDITAYTHVGINIFINSNTANTRTGSLFFQSAPSYTSVLTSYAVTQPQALLASNNTWTGNNTWNGSSTFDSGLFIGSVTIQGSNRRYRGDFSNANVSTRGAFQTSTTNGETSLSIIPAGTSTSSGIIAYNTSAFTSVTPLNCSAIEMKTTVDEHLIQGRAFGTGSHLPIVVKNGGNTSFTVEESGQFTSASTLSLEAADPIIKATSTTNDLKIQGALDKSIVLQTNNGGVPVNALEAVSTGNVTIKRTLQSSSLETEGLRLVNDAANVGGIVVSNLNTANDLSFRQSGTTRKIIFQNNGTSTNMLTLENTLNTSNLPLNIDGDLTITTENPTIKSSSTTSDFKIQGALNRSVFLQTNNAGATINALQAQPAGGLVVQSSISSITGNNTGFTLSNDTFNTGGIVFQNNNTASDIYIKQAGTRTTYFYNNGASSLALSATVNTSNVPFKAERGLLLNPSNISAGATLGLPLYSFYTLTVVSAVTVTLPTAAAALAGTYVTFRRVAAGNIISLVQTGGAAVFMPLNSVTAAAQLNILAGTVQWSLICNGTYWLQLT